MHMFLWGPYRGREPDGISNAALRPASDKRDGGEPGESGGNSAKRHGAGQGPDLRVHSTWNVPVVPCGGHAGYPALRFQDESSGEQGDDFSLSGGLCAAVCGDRGALFDAGIWNLIPVRQGVDAPEHISRGTHDGA